MSLTWLFCCLLAYSPASGSSDLREELSSTETTPPPQLDDHAVGSYPHSHFGTRSIKRYSANSSAYSQSYQSTVFSDNGNGHFRQWSNVSDRPTTSGTSVAGSYHDDGNDHADLAAAVELLLRHSQDGTNCAPAGRAARATPTSKVF